MNCQSVQELLPLYISRDLDEDRVQLITAHVHSCAACAGSVAEYHETRQLLQEFAPPAFSDAVYSGVRERVWREIEREAESRPAPVGQLFAAMFRPRVRWAAVSALILAVALVAFYFMANRANDRRQIAGAQPEASPRTPDAVATSSPANTGTMVPRMHRPQTRRRSVPAADRPSVMAENRNQQPLGSNEAALDSNKLAEPGAVQTSEKVFRLEMQTKDPNIRIIWLTPQRIKHDSPGKISKGV